MGPGALTDRLLPEPFRTTMLTPYGGQYACGWWIMDNYIGHGGEIKGFKGRLRRYVKDNNTVILLSNDRFSKLNRISRALEAILAGRAWDFPKISLARAINSTILTENSRDIRQKLEAFTWHQKISAEINELSEKK